MKRKNNYLVLFMVLAACVMMFTLAACGDDDKELTDLEEPQKPSDKKPDTPQGTLLLMQTCTTCEGSKECTTCRGTGKGCQTCKGKGIHCKSCGTSGECTRCGGTKLCTSCYGAKGTRCSWCLSKPGYCPKCVGTGKYGTATCSLCGGNKICHYCGGKPWKDCSTCRGSGECTRCYGRGTCPTCYGNPPDCDTCGGDGHCAACTNADGKCKDCTGTGEMSLSSLAFAETGGDEMIFVHGTAEWSATADVEWIRLSTSSGKGDYTLTATAAANNTASTRTGIITFAYGKTKMTINVSQTGEEVKLSTEPTSVFVNANGTGESFSIVSNTSWTIKAADSWVSCSPSSGTGNTNVTISASAYSAGTRYSSLTITDITGEVTIEVPVAQAKSRDELMALKYLLEKPLGMVDIDQKKASYYEVKAAVEESFTIGHLYEPSGSTYRTFTVYTKDNPACSNMTYQGLPIESYEYSIWSSSNVAYYHLEIPLSKATYDRKTYLNHIINDFKYCAGVTLTVEVSKEGRDEYAGKDADGNFYRLVGIDSSSVRNGSDWEDGYSFGISAYYYR